MKKMSKSTFDEIARILLTITFSGFIGWALFFVTGIGREAYRTSTPDELYGVLGWFTLSQYMIYVAILSIAAFFLLIVIRDHIVESPDELWEEN